MKRRNSIVLIGMPGAGKSTLGVLLAKEMALDFVDTDVLIQARKGKTLQQIIAERGYLNLRSIEGEIIASAHLPRHVIATGGSVVYSETGMANLRSFGTVVFLECSAEELRRRIHNYESRGIAKAPGQTFEALFTERQALYRQYADMTVRCDGLTLQEVLEQLVEALEKKRS
ncbi:shikimate kinase [Microbulbifer sp. 2205BS26-8]|uniref:shikimate kinase n=1 Tax=Microbulbifer sp. 2205BS26-8 TaxID=3064386 RepID=UPI00273D36B5|nr:shikimate kinase [Microbulbifer sp. 2205BS26-8]MDP5209748.1 shikimate kinase [Microbulbifer sp. 2205BS26-8]